jgi:hypothetical protein
VDPRFINEFEVSDDPGHPAGPLIGSQRLDPLRISFAIVERLFSVVSPTAATPGTSCWNWKPRRPLVRLAHTTRARSHRGGVPLRPEYAPPRPGEHADVHRHARAAPTLPELFDRAHTDAKPFRYFRLRLLIRFQCRDNSLT